MNDTTANPAETERLAASRAAWYDRLMGLIRTTAEEINVALGLPASGHDADLRSVGLTFGYIGNCGMRRPDGTYANDERLWSVYLPHPGRVGTSEDRIGSFRTGDVAGAQATYAAVQATLRTVRNTQARSALAV